MLAQVCGGYKASPEFLCLLERVCRLIGALDRELGRNQRKGKGEATPLVSAHGWGSGGEGSLRDVQGQSVCRIGLCRTFVS